MLRQIFSIGVRSVSYQKKINSSYIQKNPQPIQFITFYCIKTFNDDGAGTDADREKRLKVLMLEMDVCRQEGRRAPDPANVKPSQWEEILSLTSRSARWRYYAFLWQIEKRLENRIIKKEKKKLEVQERLEQLKESHDGHIMYGLFHNTMFLRIYDTTIDRWNNNKLINAMQFGPKLVIDCSYDEHMVPREAKNAAKQLMLLFADNRLDVEPFDLHLCNANLNGFTMKTLNKHIPNLLEPGFPMNIHEKSYLDVFPKKNLVYLTPHCRNDLLEYNHDDIYIVGAMVDKMNNDPLSLAKAKSQGLRMARLPLDHYLQWGSGSGKSLTINQMLSILLEIKRHGDWNEALKHVPRRKLVDFRKQEESQPINYRLEKFKDYKFDVNTWGAKKFVDKTTKRDNKRQEKKQRSKVVLDEIFTEEKWKNGN
uniref:RNA (guanine-9-)-methyltransferase domain-containing protein 1 n=1 Tax=Culicoides sonorensis TaxID=179676 RepID=A0A336M4X2_CULSO